MSYSSYHKRRISDRELHPETQMMSYGYDPFLSEGAVKPPVFLTSTFAFRSAEDGAAFFDVVAGRKPPPQDSGAGLVYSRFNHPNLEIVEDRLALLDGAEAAIVTASGMAAIAAVLLAFLRPGEQVVHSTPLYGGTETLIRRILPEWQVGGQPFVDGLSRQAMADALEAAAARGRVGLFYVETPANPTNALVDLAAVRALLDDFAARHGYRPVSACDNTMLGPIFQHPIRDGIDLSIYSLTKYVGGHSDLVAGGVVLTGGSAKMEGLIDLAEEVFHMPVRLGIPQYVTGLVDVVRNPIHATGVGLLLFGHRNRAARLPESVGGGSLKSVWNRMKSWFQVPLR